MHISSLHNGKHLKTSGGDEASAYQENLVGLLPYYYNAAVGILCFAQIYIYGDLSLHKLSFYMPPQYPVLGYIDSFVWKIKANCNKLIGLYQCSFTPGKTTRYLPFPKKRKTHTTSWSILKQPSTTQQAIFHFGTAS